MPRRFRRASVAPSVSSDLHGRGKQAQASKRPPPAEAGKKTAQALRHWARGHASHQSRKKGLGRERGLLAVSFHRSRDKTIHSGIRKAFTPPRMQGQNSFISGKKPVLAPGAGTKLRRRQAVSFSELAEQGRLSRGVHAALPAERSGRDALLSSPSSDTPSR